MTAQQDGLEIYTVGHSNLEAYDLVGLLRQHRIEVVVDVRSAPYSQYTPHFNREALSSMLQGAGIDYAYAGEYLGGRPKDATCYKNGELPPPKADYLKLVDYAEVATRVWYKKGIARLIEMAGERRVAVMCSEEDPAECHRHHLITQTLLGRGVHVWHIRREGALEDADGPKQLSLFG